MNKIIDQEKHIQAPWKAGLRFLIITLFMLAVLFLSAGTLRWWVAWVYVGMTLAVLISSRLVLLIKNPELARERVESASMEDTKSWDKYLMPFTALVGPFLSWVIAGLDFRFGWSSDLPDAIQVIALIVFFMGSMLGSWAMIVNRFFSSHVRIQTERGHQVVDSGPYRFVRHPGYAGGILAWIAAPVFFSSFWVVIPTVLVIIASLIRTALEDHTLQQELPGYQDYSRRVTARLFPRLW